MLLWLRQFFARMDSVGVLLAAALLALFAVIIPLRGIAAENTPIKAAGTPGSRITIELYSDYQCPGCKQLHFGTLQRVLSDYVYAGKVYLIFRDLPLPMHAHARHAARYANAALRLGKYEVVTDTLYRNQETWSANGQIEAQLAQVLSRAEMKKLQQLVREASIDASIERDVQRGRQQQITQTPTMVITANGKVFRIPGVVQYDVLRRFLDSLL